MKKKSIKNETCVLKINLAEKLNYKYKSHFYIHEIFFRQINYSIKC
jgi:hypothetical protein